jgi:hypothetical protein
MQAEDWTSARASFDKAAQQLQGTGLEEFAHYNASVSALVEGDASEAIERAKQSLRLNPNNDDARHNLALAQRMQQEQDQQQQDQQQEQQQEEGRDEEQQEQNQQDQQEGQDGESDNQEGEQSEEDARPEDGQQGSEPQEEPREGQISRADMERILESLERQEQEVQAKLRQAKAQQSQGKSRTIEKDW